MNEKKGDSELEKRPRPIAEISCEDDNICRPGKHLSERSDYVVRREWRIFGKLHGDSL